MRLEAGYPLVVIPTILPFPQHVPSQKVMAPANGRLTSLTRDQRVQDTYTKCGDTYDLVRQHVPPRTPSLLTNDPHSPTRRLVMAIRDDRCSPLPRLNATIDTAASARRTQPAVSLRRAPRPAGSSEDLLRSLLQ